MEGGFPGGSAQNSDGADAIILELEKVIDDLNEALADEKAESDRKSIELDDIQKVILEKDQIIQMLSLSP